MNFTSSCCCVERLYSCRATVFVLVAQQLRLHDSEHLELYLHTTASPVVEGCKEVAFGPYPKDAVRPAGTGMLGQR